MDMKCSRCGKEMTPEEAIKGELCIEYKICLNCLDEENKRLIDIKRKVEKAGSREAVLVKEEWEE